MKNEASIEIRRPIEAVFDYTNDNVAEWSIVVIDREVVEENPQGVGTKFRITTMDRGTRMNFQGEVTAFERPRFSSIHMIGDQFNIDAEYEFEALDFALTKVTQKSKVTGKGFVKIMFLLFGWLMKKSSCDAQQKELESLKQHAETMIPAA